MATYYFDSIDGNDANAGTSWGAAWKGDTKQIASYVASSNVIYLRGSWSNQVGGTFTSLSGFELRVHADGAVLDCRTRHSSGWVNVSGSKVWKKSFGYMVHRVILGSGTAHGFTEGNDVGKRYIVSVTDGWEGRAASDSQVVAALDAGAVDQTRFWYWDAVSGTLYVRSTSNSVDPDTACGGVYTVDGGDNKGTWPDRRHWMPWYFKDCTSLFFGAVEIRGAVRPLTVENTSGTIEPYLTQFPHYQWPTLVCTGGASVPSLTINNPNIRMQRPLFQDVSQTGFDDGNGTRNQGGADCVVIEGAWNAWSMYYGTIEAGVHGAITSEWYHGASVTSGLIRGTYFDLRNLSYGRAFNLQLANYGNITSFIVERVTVDGQPVNSQVNWDNFTLRYSVFRNGRKGWIGDGSTPAYVDKYNPYQNWYFRWRNSFALALSRVDGAYASTMSINNCVFWGQYDSVIAYDEGTSRAGFAIVDCWFIKNPALAGASFGDRVYFNDGGASITFTTCKSAGYGSVPAGVTAMTGAEETLYTARAKATTLSFSPSTATPAASNTQTVTTSVLDRDGATVADFAGTVSTSTDAAVATASAPTAATNVSGQVNYVVTGVGAGSTTIELRATQGAMRSLLPVTVNGVATGIRVLQSAKSTTLGGSSVACSISGVTPGNVVVAVVGGYWDGATGVTLTDNQSPTGTWTEVVSKFHTGGTSSSIGIFAHTSTVAASTANLTVTATPVKVPAATNAYVTLILLEIAEGGTVQASASAMGTSATPTVDLPSVTATALVIAGTAQSGYGNPTISAGSGFTMQQVKNDQAGIGVETKKVTVNGQNDPDFVLASTVGGISSSIIEWPAVALILSEGGAAAVEPTIVTTTMPSMTEGVGGTVTLTITGTGPFTLSKASGTAPTGTTYSGNNVVISGSATAGSYTWTIRATGPTALTDDQEFTLVIAAAPVAPSILTTSLPDGVAGTAYSATLENTGTAPVTWFITGGALPLGLSLNTTTGAITGIPLAVGASQIFVQASNTAGSASRSLQITIAAPPVVVPVPDTGDWVRVPRDAEVWIRVPRDT